MKKTMNELAFELAAYAGQIVAAVHYAQISGDTSGANTDIKNALPMLHETLADIAAQVFEPTDQTKAAADDEWLKEAVALLDLENLVGCRRITHEEVNKLLGIPHLPDDAEISVAEAKRLSWLFIERYEQLEEYLGSKHGYRITVADDPTGPATNELYGDHVFVIARISRFCD